MYLLDECQEFQNIIAWAEDGHSFIVHDPNEFEEKVLPKIFKEARFSSFLRKVRILICLRSLSFSVPWQRNF